MIVSPTTSGGERDGGRQPARVLARPRDPVLQAHPPVVAEVRRRQPGPRVDRRQIAVARAPDDPRLVTVLPVGHPAVVPGGRQRRAAGLVDARVVDPQCLAGAGVHRGRLIERRRQVQHAVHHQRRRRQARDARPRHPEIRIGLLQALEQGLGRDERNAVLVRDRQMCVGGAPAPRQLEIAEVVRRDPVERRVLRAPRVGRVGAPLAAGSAFLRARRDHRQPRGQEPAAHCPCDSSHPTLPLPPALPSP